MDNNERKELVCKLWLPLANEYVKFLKRYEFDTLSIITSISDIGLMVSIYANEEKYLRLSLEDKKFMAEERQILELLDGIERLSEIIILHINKEEEK